MSESFFKLSRELEKDFADSRRIRMHVHYNEVEHTLVYEYFTSTFLRLLDEHPDLPLSKIKKILRHTGEAVKELHAKDYIHIGMMRWFPNSSIDTNISAKISSPTTSWLTGPTMSKATYYKVDKVALGDFDLALKLVNNQPLRGPHAIGNVMWRSPEGQSGKGITKASDVYSFGLVVGDLNEKTPSFYGNQLTMIILVHIWPWGWQHDHSR